MMILAFDSALEGGSAAILDGHKIVASRMEPRARGQAETLLPMIEAVLGDAHLDYQALDAIAVTMGPGTFTGLRIALATARGIGRAANKPVIGVTTLEALAATIPETIAKSHLSVAAIDARRGEIYLQLFGPAGIPLISPIVISPERALDLLPQKPLALVGSGAKLLHPLMTHYPTVTLIKSDSIDAVKVALCAAAKPLPEIGSMPAPLYLRAPDAKLPQITI